MNAEEAIGSPISSDENIGDDDSDDEDVSLMEFIKNCFKQQHQAIKDLTEEVENNHQQVKRRLACMSNGLVTAYNSICNEIQQRNHTTSKQIALETEPISDEEGSVGVTEEQSLDQRNQNPETSQPEVRIARWQVTSSKNKVVSRTKIKRLKKEQEKRVKELVDALNLTNNLSSLIGV